jgi:serine/threonine protein kinase
MGASGDSQSKEKTAKSDIDRWLQEIEALYGEKRHKEFEQEKGYLLDYLKVLDEQINTKHYSICTITSPLFVGGSGVVFKAVHRNIPTKELVLKFNCPLAPELLPVIDGRPTSMVETERQILPLLNHANIIQALDEGHFETTMDNLRPLSFIVMPFIQDNVTLKKYAASLALSSQTEITPDLIDESMRKLIFAIHQWIGALIYTHQKGYIYLDVKPDNALLDKEGHLFLIDFGSAQRINPESN